MYAAWAIFELAMYLDANERTLPVSSTLIHGHAALMAAARIGSIPVTSSFRRR
jgi:hypothetical protein